MDKLLKATHGRVLHKADHYNKPVCGVRIKSGQVVLNSSSCGADCLRCKRRWAKAAGSDRK